MVNAPGSWQWLADELCASYLVAPETLHATAQPYLDTHPNAAAEELGEHLAAEGLLTPFQLDRVIAGDARLLVLGPYVLTEQIGEGCIGVVYRATGKADGKTYAVKILPKRDHWNMRRARIQVRKFAGMPPSDVIVPIVDLGAAGQRYYLVAPFVEGESLHNRVKSAGRLAPREVARIGRIIAEGLAGSHAHGLFHGLVKPTNVQLGADNQVRVLDFGVGAILADNDTQSLLDTSAIAATTIGIMDCAAPEFILDAANQSPASDQYSLGCTLYFAVSGRYPFPNGTVFEKMVSHQKEVPVPLRTVNPDGPAELIAVIERLLAKAPGERFPDMAVVQAALLAIESNPKLTPAPGKKPGLRFSLPGVPAPRPAAPVAEAPPPLPEDVPLPPANPGPDLRQFLNRPLGDSGDGPVIGPAVTNHIRVPLENAPGGKRSRKPALAMPVALPRKSVMMRLVELMAFWRKEKDDVVCSLVSPPIVHPGESITLSVVLHLPEPLESAASITGTALPNAVVRASAHLYRPIGKGEPISLQLAILGVRATDPQVVSWEARGQAILFTVTVPPSVSGELAGAITVGEEGEILVRLPFRVPVAGVISS